MNEYLPNSYLLGIQLTISTHSGQQVVYSYPPTTVACASSVSNNFNVNKTSNKHKDGELKLQRTHDESDSSSSSSSSWSSGLSDSELSTDEADESFSSKSDETTSSMSFHERMSTEQLLDMFKTGTDGVSEVMDVQMNELFFSKENYQDIDKIFGFNSEFVAEFCTPDRDLCNTRFEFTIDEFCFLGFPIHNDSNGKWRKSKHSKHTSRKSVSISHSKRKKSVTTLSVHSSGSKNAESSSTQRKNPELEEDEIVKNQTPTPSELEDDINDLSKSMNMFHVCFILNPPLIEYNNRVDDMYQHVVAKLSLLLRYIQSKTQFVSDECSIILKEREYVTKQSDTYQKLRNPWEKGKYLYERILNKSSLARALTKCVDQIHQNEIASIKIGDKMISLQIPIQNEFSTLPNNRLVEILPHSYLTSIVNRKFIERASMAYNSKVSGFKTSNTGGNYSNNDSAIRNSADVRYLLQDDGADDDDDILDYTLLLLDDPIIILKNLESMTLGNASFQDNNVGDVNTIILKELIKQIQPTVPLRYYHYIITDILQIEGSNITYDILRSFALHLIYWRHARIIIPISSKYKYAVSPLLTLTVTYLEESKIFKDKFPSLPSLSYFLGKLSEPDILETTKNPKASNLSKTMGNNEKHIGIRPFGSLIPSKEHKGIYLGALSWLIKHGYVYQLLTFVYIRVDKKIKMHVEEDLEKEGFRVKNKDKKNAKSERNIQDLSLNSITNEINSKTIAPDPTQKQNKPESVGVDNLIPDSINNSIMKSDNPSNDDILHFEFDDPELQQDFTIILEPERATALEKRWLYKCVSEQAPDIQLLFKRLLKYFNGKTPLELVILKENISRHEIKKLFQVLDKYIMEVLHW
ncbi:similar to Saccharomyces cerevisiae YHL023C NPR3 Subunit of the conserved Npr2/3 complex that mediates downregulation of TORC1 activity upon amino acid limitation [Maudiozyma barnettii]|uniref:Nitrogen permease regulator 3 n=1 Tax=Maudiozyma barnettii TaxID=61262 RepID=A0A8H2VD13_9SACH|nr:Npr3p [Kazachstania barnettii]CAB4253004.1 similar to Saccharomyces cerevisiae YHL023C NPR3 Subunit of the conserved Npr2/3 complex that mediates downregulation of TORC1 activity upon amino acid limitation [Kazachstania barnettii]CAD1780144.1 similar to Saccharomyces cerevisiae YHL023C NPR3 Subunit of the conserved Npr2/3 complex that mediates downregulation of TORC1 activity upon amino acid limitation [Kazachstania barnettii]